MYIIEEHKSYPINGIYNYDSEIYQSNEVPKYKGLAKITAKSLVDGTTYVVVELEYLSNDRIDVLSWLHIQHGFLESKVNLLKGFSL